MKNSSVSNKRKTKSTQKYTEPEENETKQVSCSNNKSNSDETNEALSPKKLTVSAEAFDNFIHTINKFTNEINEKNKNTNIKTDVKLTSGPSNIETSPKNQNKDKPKDAIEDSIFFKKLRSLNTNILYISKSGKTVPLKTKNYQLILTKDNIPSDIFQNSQLPGALPVNLKNTAKINNTIIKPVTQSENVTQMSLQKYLINNKPKTNIISDKTNIISDKTNVSFADQGTQTQVKSFSDVAVQTEIFDSFDDIDDSNSFSDLIQYFVGTPKYSSDLDEERKTSLLNMSKNISYKDKNEYAKIQAQILRERKIMFIHDLQNCVCFDTFGNMPIHNAVLSNDLPLLNRQIYVLSGRNVSINMPNSQRYIPIQLAVINNCNIKILQTLLDKGGAVTVKDMDGNSLLHLAILYSSDRVLDILICASKTVDIINTRNDEGITPLMLAVTEKKDIMVDKLLKAGADPNLRDEKSGRTALFHAVENDLHHIINLLLAYKADPKINNFLGLCALDAAKDLSPTTREIFEPPPSKYEPVVHNRGIKRGRKPKDSNNQSKMTFVTKLQKIPKKMDKRPKSPALVV